MKNLTAKEISINCLESIKRDLENALEEGRKELTSIEWYCLTEDVEILSKAITIIKENEVD